MVEHNVKRVRVTCERQVVTIRSNVNIDDMSLRLINIAKIEGAIGD